MGDLMDEIVENSKPAENLRRFSIFSQRSPDYKLAFINGAICNITARGEIVCDFHLESRDRPVEQKITVSENEGIVTESVFVETGDYSRDVKFGIVMNAAFAKDLVALINGKITEAEEAISERAKKDAHK
jgi:hypothetical protein